VADRTDEISRPLPAPLRNALDIVSLPDAPTTRAGSAMVPPGPESGVYQAVPDAADEVERELDVRAGLGLFASEKQLKQLLAIARQFDVKAGQVLAERGSPMKSVFQLADGELEMRGNPGEPVWKIENRGAVGFVDFMLGRPWSRTAVAVKPSRVLELDAGAYRDYLEDNFEVGHQVIAQLGSRLMGDVLASPDAAAILGRSAKRDGKRDGKRALDYQSEVPLVIRIMLLSRVPAFSGGTIQALANLAQVAREVRYKAGEVIAEAGATSNELSVLVAGEVTLTHPTQDLTATRHPVDLVAHASELATGPRPLHVVASQDSLVLQIDREELLDRVEEHFELAMSMFAYIATVTEELNNATATTGEAI
jgi:CRP-like cAMP-binding protein